MPAEPLTPDPSSLTVECPRAPARGPWRVDLGTEQEPRSVTLQLGEELTLGSGRAAVLRVADPADSIQHCRLLAHSLPPLRIHPAT